MTYNDWVEVGKIVVSITPQLIIIYAGVGLMLGMYFENKKEKK